MATIFLADEFLLLEIEGEFQSYDHLFEPEALDILDADQAESHPRELGQWGYRVPYPGVKYYFFE